MAHKETELEVQAARKLPAADQLAGRFVLQKHDHLKSDDEYAQVMNHLGFGVDFSDYMARATWTAESGWHNKVIEPYGAISLDPGASVLHYGQEIFEGLKVYRHDDGTIWTFRPSYNGARLNYSGARLAIPELPIEDFIASIVDLVRADQRWVPNGEGASLYLRPFIFASESFLGVRAATRYEYVVIASPSGPYFPNGFKPIAVWVDQKYHRAGPGGMGDAKTGGNYAASLLPKIDAHHRGFDEVLFLDGATNSNLDELGGMNVFVVLKDGSVKTPQLTGNILPGATRSSIIRFLEEEGTAVEECTISLSSLLEGIESGDVQEMFACGTAAVVTSIGRIAGENFDLTLPSSVITRRIYDELTSIQLGTREDSYGWLYQIA
ncbi:branched-chain amino acid aminotransferase [Arcanobacterium pluranimalium]|uniref:branched-chain amino acid aminotransferase n=1 Tax=Arcanobacterium pluranimalium TaxID=108028 RepID=UPI00195A7EF7|nr:branched-chain amino acid aminotransferase [Arcanobacterium pluranimalium]MBM7825737.1 branched-chain amino acid aminotransferase [Arcanobacterium pluranimalium]